MKLVDFGKYDHEDESFELWTIDIDTVIGRRFAFRLAERGFLGLLNRSHSPRITELTHRRLARLRRWERSNRRSSTTRERKSVFEWGDCLYERFNGGFFLKKKGLWSRADFRLAILSAQSLRGDGV